MIPQSKGKIFLAAERGHTETDWFRSDNTFPFGNYQRPDKQPFGPLYVLNNDTLAGGKSFSLSIEEDTDVIIIPTVGAVQYNDTNGNESIVEAGQAQRMTTVAGTTITFTNPYAEDPINFLQLWLKKWLGSAPLPLQITAFDIDTNRNKLTELFTENKSDDSRFFLGKLGGREEVEYHLTDSGKCLFFYVLEGAFEVAYRLLETGDGLALWDIAETEIEALSNDAIILAIELETATTI